MRARSEPSRVLLVAMPWARLEHPSIQLGLLKSILAASGIASAQRHFYLDFVEHIGAWDSSLGPDAYDDVATKHLIGDWIFAVPPYLPAATTPEDYLQYLGDEGETESFVANVRTMRNAVPAFLDRVAAQILADEPDVVGFTTTFGQTVPSLVLALVLKQRAPDIKIILGGANCDGAMGEALLRSFPWIDAVVRGEAEPVLGGLVGAWLRHETPKPSHGLCLRSADDVIVVPMSPPVATGRERLPFVDYDDYFDRLASHRYASEISPQVSIPFESARGCWWGEKHHCTFCGLNGSSMTFRPFDASRVLEELLQLSQKYQRLEFNAADNIMGSAVLGTLIPRLMKLRFDFRLFYEVKANLKKSQIADMRAAGITQIQPGLESLSTAALARIRKGCTALQNIRLLKWCATYGIKVHWNIIHGLPGDSSAEYLEMAAVARNCMHLEAPNLIPLSVERFSPYHDDPAAFGLELLGPKLHYRHTYPVGTEVLNDIAYAFEHRQVDRMPSEPGLAKLRQAVDDWQAAQAEGTSTLTIVRGPAFSIVQDRRRGRVPSDYRLGPIESAIYDACDAGIRVSALCDQLGSRVSSPEPVFGFLEELAAAGLVFREGARYLSLAVEARPRELESVRA